MPNYLELSYVQVGLAALLILINGGISVALKLQLEKSLAIASARTIAQLSMIGLVLEWIFRRNQWPIVVGAVVVMTIVAGWTASSRLPKTV